MISHPRKPSTAGPEQPGVPTRRETMWWLMLAGGAAATGWLLQRTGLPAAFLLGPMITAIAVALCGAGLHVRRGLFLASLAVVGIMISRAVTGQLLATIGRDWPIMLLVVGLTVSAAGAVGWLLARFGSLPAATAAWGSSPGAAAAMTAMSEEYGADPRLVAFMQYLRVLIVVLSASLVSRWMLGSGTGGHVEAPVAAVMFPPLWTVVETLLLAAAGAALATAIRMPSAALLGPLIAGSLAHASGLVTIAVPPWLAALAYALIGTTIGLRFTPETVRVAIRAIPQLLLSTAGLIVLCGLSAWLLVSTLRIDPLTAYLATSPGGLDSVAIIALGSGVDVPLVLAIQTIRLLVVLATGPLVARLIARSA